MNYDSWLEQPYQDRYAEEDKLDARVEELLVEGRKKISTSSKKSK